MVLLGFLLVLFLFLVLISHRLRLGNIWTRLLLLRWLLLLLFLLERSGHLENVHRLVNLFVSRSVIKNEGQDFGIVHFEKHARDLTSVVRMHLFNKREKTLTEQLFAGFVVEDLCHLLGERLLECELVFDCNFRSDIRIEHEWVHGLRHRPLWGQLLVARSRRKLERRTHGRTRSSASVTRHSHVLHLWRGTLLARYHWFRNLPTSNIALTGIRRLGWGKRTRMRVRMRVWVRKLVRNLVWNLVRKLRRRLTRHE